MKYLGNAFAIGMVKESALILIDTITKKEFEEQIPTSYSIIGHPEIAEAFNVALNRETVYLEAGDTLYVVTPIRRPAENKVVEHGDSYQFIPETEGWTYKKVTIIASGDVTDE